jgi:hypothetical protein
MFVHLHNSPPLRNQTQEIHLWGEHGENFNEASVIEKSKEGIVVTVLASLQEALKVTKYFKYSNLIFIFLILFNPLI